MSASPSRLQIAARMHELLRVQIGFEIEIERLLTRDRYARDVLLVCDACTDTELPRLAAEFRRLTPRPLADATGSAVPAPAAAFGASPRDGAGFSHSQPASVPGPGAGPASPRPDGWRARLPWR